MSSRTGKANPLGILLLTAGALIAVLLLLLRGPAPPQQSAPAILIYCAAGLRGPVEKIAQQYEQLAGVKVNVQFGGSNSLLNQLEVDKINHPDLFLPADGVYIDRAQEKGLTAETIPVAQARAVLAVRRGNPRQIATLDDLLQDHITLSIPSPDQAAVGHVAQTQLQTVTAGDTNRWAQLEAQTIKRGVFKPTVNDVASDLQIGAADAGIVWDFLVKSPGFRDALEIVPIPELEGLPSSVRVAVLQSSKQPTAALRFARFLTARDRGLLTFAEAGMAVVEGDLWSDHPTVSFFCGAVNRRAVEQVIAKFSEREGVTVNTVYDGCGTLTGRMKSISRQRPESGFPDLYMACDLYHLTNVGGWFQNGVRVSSAEIVIAVPKGSRQVTCLEDLVKPGIRVAIGQPDQCTIGLLTRNLLVDKGLYDQLKARQSQPGEVVVEKPSSALLVPDVVTGHVDATVAYVTDVLANRDTVDIVPIDSALNRAVQPVSVSRTSDHKALVGRLHQQITEARQAFEKVGFRYEFNPLDNWDAGSLVPGEQSSTGQPATPEKAVIRE